MVGCEIGTFVTFTAALVDDVDAELVDDTFVFVVFVVFVVFAVDGGGDASALAESDAGRRRRNAGI